MSRYKLSDEQFLPYWKQWSAQPTPENMDKLLRSIQPILAYGVAYYSGDAKPSPLLLGYARAIAIDAAKKYDPQRGSFVAYMLTHLQRIQRRAAEARQIVRQPERAAMATAQLERSRHALAAKLGREPTAAELADTTGLSIRTIERLRQQAKRVVPEPAFPEMPSAKPLGTEGQAATELLEYAYIDADPRDKLIMEHHFGLHGAPRLSSTDIARKLKISPAAVTQRLTRLYKTIPEWQALLSS